MKQRTGLVSPRSLSKYIWLGLLCSAPWITTSAYAQEQDAAEPAASESTSEEGAASAAESSETDSETAKPSEEVIQRAGGHFERGLALYRDAEYRLALIEFERAYQLVPNYRVKYNIAQVSIQIGRYAHALRALEDYLEQGGDNISEERRQNVQTDLAMLAGRTARVLITSNVSDAEILLDDKVIAKTPLSGKLLIDAGEHRLTVRQRGYQPKTEQLTLAGGDDIELSFELSEVKKEKPVVLVKEVRRDTPAPVAKEEPFPYATLGWVATGGFTVGAVVTGIVGLTAKDELDSLARPDPDQGDPDDVRQDMDSARERARTWFLVSDILKGAALAAGAASLYLTLSGDDTDDPTKDKPASTKAKRDSVRLKAGASLNYVWLEGRF